MFRFGIGLACLTAAIFAGTISAQNSSFKAPAPLTYTSVKPIFTRNCIACHSGPAAQQQLMLDSYEKIMKGSKNGKVIIKGKPDESKLIKLLKTNGPKKMPPTGAMPSADIQKINDWVKQGAKK